MALAHVSEEQAAAGFPSSTFSFNLPPPEGNTRWSWGGGYVVMMVVMIIAMMVVKVQ